ncbi:hypothetical protein JHK85_007627 [Glycine max]|nr:hypothetical protein JHK85_007627 [Glycine max]
MGAAWRQLKVMLRKNWLLKIRHPFVTAAEVISLFPFLNYSVLLNFNLLFPLHVSQSLAPYSLTLFLLFSDFDPLLNLTDSILLPTIVLLLLVAVRTKVDTQIHPVQPHIQKDMFVEVGNGISPNFQQVLQSLLDRGEYLAFAPDTNETKLLIDVVSIKFPLLKLVSRVYKDEVELETYIRSDAYGTCNQARNCSNPKIKGAVVFYEQGPQSFDYSIRLNHTWAFSGFPDVTTIMDTNGPFLNDLELGVSAVPTMQYSFSGFLTEAGSNNVATDSVDGCKYARLQEQWRRLEIPTFGGDEDVKVWVHEVECYFRIWAAMEDEKLEMLQQMVDSFIILIAQQSDFNFNAENLELPLPGFYDNNFSLKNPWTQFNPARIRIAPFPTREYTDDQFQSIIKRVMGILYLLGFLYPISRLISYSVYEKEQKIKEGLYMMGLNDGIFHLSWFITYALQFAISSGILTACTMDNLFKYSDKTLVFAYFFVFGLSAIMLSFFISTFFKRAKTAVAVGTLAFLGAFFPYYTVNEEGVSIILKVIASLLSPTAFALGSINFADYERAHVGLRWSNIWRVLPREYGLRYPWSFIFQKDFWRKKKILKHCSSGFKVEISDKNSESEGNLSGEYTSKSGIEAISLEMKQQELDGRCIQIRNLHKVYATKKGDCCAVNSLQLTLYENQILALLGHNGAGKSTTISMLVGLLPPTSGDALVFGKNIVSDIDEIRKVLGVCPQHDILFPELTVREHLELFATLKGVEEHSLDNAVINMADEVGLADKINSIVRTLSGGMKRKLSLGIALIGSSKVIVLDEPTSGMDPYSMRLTWQLIKKIKKGRIILLTTHSMDEADELGDRIAIMANGSLKCCGSSLFLKHHYGVGYTLTLVKSAPTASIAGDIVYRHVPSATCVSEFFLLKTLNMTNWLFKKKLWVFGEWVGTEISFRLPMASSSAFERMFREIEGCMKKTVSNMELSGNGDKDSLGIESYGISVTTLEELKPHPDQQSLTLSTSHFNPLLSGGGGGGPIPFNLSLPIAEKVAQNVIGGWIQRFKPSSYRFPNSEKALADAVEAAGPTLGPALLSMSEYLMSSFNESYQSRYGAIVMDDQNNDGSLGYTVLHNCSCQHAAPTFINLMNSAILRLATHDTNMTIQTRNHPLPTTQSQRLQRHDLDAFSAAVIVNIAFSFIPASFAVSIVKVSVLSYWASTFIWDFVSFLFPASFAIVLFYVFGLDQFVGGVSLLPTILMLLEYGLAIASSTYCLTFFFFDHTMAQNVVLLIHFFTGLILMVISFIMGLMPSTMSANSFLKNFFRISPGFCFADGLASLALLRQGMKDKTSDGVFDWNVTGASICYLAVESFSYFLLTLALEMFPSLNLTSFMIKKWWGKINIFQHNNPYLEPLLESSSETVAMDFDEDVDVKTERNRVLSGSLDNSIIYLRNLRKVYFEEKHHGRKVAVDSLTFSVQEGECFGFLGTNGAGKTTTISMLCGEECPSDGTAFIFGKDICSHPKAARRYIGYCPQFDALLEFLTVREHLELYARIKGVPDFAIDNVCVVMEKLTEFDLLKHANKPSFSLSGGNKRKLSVAIAMIGDPPIVILDEPSTGMDPIAKRFMWDVISRISTRRGKTAVILTTHSMNEAQALCTRIGIMVGGRLRCIGSPQHLKTRFGNHLELEVKPTEVSSADLQNLCQAIQERLLDVPSHPRSLLNDLEICIGGTDSVPSGNTSIAEISLTREMIGLIGRWLDNEERVKTLISGTPVCDGASQEQLSEQLFRDGGIPLPVFSEWWLSKQKFSEIDSFILSSFRGARCQGCNGLSIRYQVFPVCIVENYSKSAGMGVRIPHEQSGEVEAARPWCMKRKLPVVALASTEFQGFSFGQGSNPRFDLY